MKPIVTAFGICALLLGATAAHGQDSYTWTGAGSSWSSAANWSGPAQDYPGKDNAGDDATINADTANDTVVVSGTVANSVAWVLVDADTANVNLELNIASGGSITFGDVYLWGDDTYTATLDVDENMSASSTAVKNYVDIQAYRGKTFTAGTLTIGVSGGTYGDLDITAPDGSSGTGDVSASSLVIYGGTSNASIVTVGTNARLITN